MKPTQDPPVETPRVLPVEAEVRADDLERQQNDDDAADGEAESQPGKGENAPGFLKPDRKA